MEQDAPALEGLNSAESARTGTRTSARGPAVELITRGEPRRRWSDEQKQAIAAESLTPGVSPTAVARRYGISSGLLYTWRKALRAAQPGLATGFARVEVMYHDRPAAGVPTPQAAEPIAITLPDGTMLRVPARIDPRALRSLLGALRR
jgi:transposase